MSGMLWAALGGASRAGMKIMDEREKAQAKEEVRAQSLLDDDRKRVQSIADRQDALKYEMDLKVEYAKSERETEVKALERADVRASEIRDARGSREFKGGVGMLSSLEDMGISPDTALQTAKDRMAGARETGAPGSVRKGLMDDFNTEVKAENARQKEAARDARDEARNAEHQASQARVFAQQDKTQARHLAAVGARGSGGGSDTPTGQSARVKEAEATIAKQQADLDKDIEKAQENVRPLDANRQEKLAQIVKTFAARQKAIDDARKIWQPRREALDGTLFPGTKPVVPESTVKDNPTTTTIKALPAGSKQVGKSKGDGRPVFEAPDGTRYIQ